MADITRPISPQEAVKLQQLDGSVIADINKLLSEPWREYEIASGRVLSVRRGWHIGLVRKHFERAGWLVSCNTDARNEISLTFIPQGLTK
jgi:hypothetical protein